MTDLPAADFVVLVPTRTRPHSVAALAQDFADTCTADTWLVWLVDGCDDADAYQRAYHKAVDVYPKQFLKVGPRRRLVATLNHYAHLVATAATAPYAIGYLGDDHHPATRGWDSRYVNTLRELGTGIVYGDDLIQGEDLPTQVAMTTDIVAALGYLAPPGLVHMYCDNVWKDLGHGAGCLTYLPDVIVRHDHPSAGNAAWDDSYLDSNSAERYAADRDAYTRYRTEQLHHDIQKVKQLRA